MKLLKVIIFLLLVASCSSFSHNYWLSNENEVKELSAKDSTVEYIDEDDEEERQNKDEEEDLEEYGRLSVLDEEIDEDEEIEEDVRSLAHGSEEEDDYED